MPIVSTGQISIVDVNDGTSPISVIMSNETCTVPANIGGTVLSFDNTGPTIKVYEGDRVLINPSSGQLSAGTWNVVSSTSDTNLGIPVAVIAANGESVTYPNIEYWSTGNAILTTKVVYTIEGITYTGKPFTVIKEQVITKAMQGSTGITGTAASYYSLEADVAVIKKSASGTLTPESITLKAFRNTTTKAAYSGRFKIYENSNTTASYTSTANESIKAYSTSNITSKLKAELYAANGTTTLLDTQEFLLVEDGSSSIIINVSNANYAIPTAYDGTVATYEGSGTSITVKEGITSLTYRTTLGTNASSFTVGTPIVSIGSITVGARSGDTTTTAILADHTNMGSSDVVTITYPITYNRANGSQATENVTQTITKSKQGVRGSRTLYASDAAYTSTYDYDGATTTYAAGLASYRKKATDIVYAATSGSSPRSPINGDTVTFSNNSSYVFTLTYDASTSTWAAPGTVIDGSLLVTGSVTASKINSNGLEIRDSAGTLILGAGTSNNLDFSRIGGATKPADNATAGAVLNKDRYLASSSYWDAFSGARASFVSVTDGAVGSTAARSSAAAASNWMNGVERIPVDFNKTYQFHGYARTVSGSGGKLYLGVALFDGAGATIAGAGTQWLYVASGVTPPAAWTKYQADFGKSTSNPFPSNAVTMSTLFILSYSGGTSIHEVQDIVIEDITAAADAQSAAEAYAAAQAEAARVTANAYADGKVTAEELRAISDATAKANAARDSAIASASSGANLCFNADFSNGTAGWTIANNPFSANFGIQGAGATWAVNGGVGEGSGTASIHQNNATASGYFEVVSDPIPVEAGKRYCVSAYTGAHRANSDVFAYWANADGNYVGNMGADVEYNTEQKAGGQQLANYKRQQQFGIAPSNATNARVVLRKFATKSGYTDSWLFVARVQFEQVGTLATSAGPWSAPGASTALRASIDAKANAAQSAAEAYAAAGLANKISTNAASALSATVSVNAVTGAGFRAGDLTWDAEGAITGGKGVAMTPGGLVGHNGTKTTFAINATTGDAVFAGELSAAKGTFSGTLSAADGIFDGDLSAAVVKKLPGRSWTVANASYTSGYGLLSGLTTEGEFTVDAIVGKSYQITSINPTWFHQLAYGIYYDGNAQMYYDLLLFQWIESGLAPQSAHPGLSRRKLAFMYVSGNAMFDTLSYTNTAFTNAQLLGGVTVDPSYYPTGKAAIGFYVPGGNIPRFDGASETAFISSPAFGVANATTIRVGWQVCAVPRSTSKLYYNKWAAGTAHTNSELFYKGNTADYAYPYGTPAQAYKAYVNRGSIQNTASNGYTGYYDFIGAGTDIFIERYSV